jgi:hypothetical protein
MLGYAPVTSFVVGLGEMIEWLPTWAAVLGGPR